MLVDNNFFSHSELQNRSRSLSAREQEPPTFASMTVEEAEAAGFDLSSVKRELTEPKDTLHKFTTTTLPGPAQGFPTLGNRMAMGFVRKMRKLNPDIGLPDYYAQNLASAVMKKASAQAQATKSLDGASHFSAGAGTGPRDLDPKKGSVVLKARIEGEATCLSDLMSSQATYDPESGDISDAKGYWRSSDKPVYGKAEKEDGFYLHKWEYRKNGKVEEYVWGDLEVRRDTGAGTITLFERDLGNPAEVTYSF